MTVWKDTRMLAKAAAKAAVQLLKGQKLTTTGTVRTAVEEGAGVHHPAGRRSQGELDEALHVGLPQEERHLQRLVQEVLLERLESRPGRPTGRPGRGTDPMPRG